MTERWYLISPDGKKRIRMQDEAHAREMRAWWKANFCHDYTIERHTIEVVE